MPQNEVEKFLSDTEQNPKQVDVLDAPLVPDETGATGQASGNENNSGEDNSGGELKPRNRRERRLMEKLSAERESSSFMAGKLAARDEAKSAITEESDYLKAVERIYGTDSPEAQIATDLLKKAIIGAREDAKTMALAEIRDERRREVEEARQAEKQLDDMVDEIEDEYGVTLTDTQERAFFTLLERMSPKDKEGNVKEYADPHAVWEVFQEKLNKRPTDNRAKDMSSRSMTQSGSSTESNLNTDVTTRFLKEQGII